MVKTLNNIIKNSKLFLAGAGLYSLINFGGCAVLDEMSDAERLSAAGTAISIGADNQTEALIGLVAKTIGDNQVQKEIAREGKTEVNIYGAGQEQQKQGFDYSQMPDEFKIIPDTFSCNYWKDENGNGTIEFDEITGFKNTFASYEPITIFKRYQNMSGERVKIDLRAYSVTRFGSDKYERVLKQEGIIPSNDFLFKLIIPPNTLKSSQYHINFWNHKGKALLSDIGSDGEFDFFVK